MSTKATHIAFLVLIAAMVGFGVAAYPYLPEQVASHWNAAGEADGTTGKFWGVFLFPAILAGFYLLYAAVPYLDPLKKNIDGFRNQYNAMFLVLGGFMTYVFALSMAWNLGNRFDFSTAMLPACAVLLWAIGALMQRSKRNWFVGIRTPWTLSSDTVWACTHRFGGRMFKIAAVFALAGAFIGGTAGIIFFVITLLIASIGPVVYSYLAYRKERQR